MQPQTVQPPTRPLAPIPDPFAPDPSSKNSTNMPPTPPSNVSAQPASQPSKGGVVKKLLFVLIALVLLGSVGYAGYYYGGKKAMEDHEKTEANHDTATMATLSVPKDATVTAECVAQRGKQYIVPKNIPDGPIYDVNNGKVVAVEYLVNVDEVSKMPEKFANLTAGSVTIDHITVMPMDAHAGVGEKHVHVIAYTIPAAEAASITCTTGSTPTETMHTH
jgi:hypothetical protein